MWGVLLSVLKGFNHGEAPDQPERGGGGGVKAACLERRSPRAPALAIRFPRNKIFLLRLPIKMYYCRSLCDRVVAFLIDLSQTARARISNSVSEGKCHLLHYYGVCWHSASSRLYCCILLCVYFIFIVYVPLSRYIT